MPGGGFREFTTTLSPRALKERNGERLMYALGAMNDVIMEKHRQGVKAHFVDDCDDSALTYIGNDRGVLRGLTESDASYRARLKRSLDDQQRAGNAWAVLSQVLGFLLTDTPAARTVSAQYSAAGVATLANWQEYAAGADPGSPPVFARDVTGEWDWDSATPSLGSWGWWRWYLVLDAVAPNAWTTAAPTWGGTGTTWGGYSGSWGVTTSSLVGKSIKLIVAQWKSGIFHWCVISFDATEFCPGAAVLPDGNYGRWSKIVNGVYVRARSSNARYFEGQ